MFQIMYLFKPIMQSKNIKIDGVGSVLLERSRRARHISVSIRPFKGIRVAVPRGVSFKKAESVALSKRKWMMKHRLRMNRREQEAIALKQKHQIDFAKARRQLVARLDELSEKHGIPYNRVFIRNQKTRWGSCSQKNNINLNINLVRMPDELIDYTILHELAHIRVKNHSKQFWDELESLVADARKLDRKLSRFNLLLA
jgi:predicted metal-dependent hydrolase